MQLPILITFRDVAKTPDIKEFIEQQARKLEKFCPHMISCRVAVERPQKSQRAGNPYRVRLDIAVPPGKEVVVVKDPLDNDMHDELRTVILDAFKAARRQLDALVERQRGEVKRHEEAVAFVTRLFPEAGYGFIRTADGRDVYFHRNSVADDDFDRLAIGTQVRFEEEEGLKGPQATTVQIVDKPGVRITGLSADSPVLTTSDARTGQRESAKRKRTGKSKIRRAA